MSDFANVMAKLSGIKQAVASLMSENVSRGRSAGQVLTRASFKPDDIAHYFDAAAIHLLALQKIRPDLYSDFPPIKIHPEMTMARPSPDVPAPIHFSRAQAERLVRDIDQIFEIRANSELSQPAPLAPRCVFITHGRSNDWRVAQAFIEKDVRLLTLELAQEASQGRTIIEKLDENSSRCDSAVIVMTGDDTAVSEVPRVRENVMHEIGFFQGRYGRDRVILLHEEGTSVPTNLAGVVYVPFPKGGIDAGFHVLHRELKAIYNF